jgi:dihydrofolate reductase
MATNKAFLMGRVLYEEWAGYWPNSDDGDLAGFFNSQPKYVLSDSMKRADWNNTTIISGDVVPQIKDLKDSTDGDVVVTGSATLVRALLRDGLIDELRVLLHPILVGHGRRLFEGDMTHTLELVNEETLSNGVLNLTYAPTTS